MLASGPGGHFRFMPGSGTLSFALQDTEFSYNRVNNTGTMPKAKQDHTLKPVGLKDLARYLELSTATISTVLNGSPAAQEIPAVTQERILAAAEKFNYRPNAMARSLRGMRSHTVGVLVPEISEGYGALVLGAVGDYLLS